MARDQRHFAEELEELKQRLLFMGGLAEERVRLAMRALVERDRDLVADIISGDQAINSMQLEIDDRCFKLLALHQPMAVDLRAIVAAVKINSDLERVGDLAVNIAEAAGRCILHAPVKALIDLPNMGALAELDAPAGARRLRHPRHQGRPERPRAGRCAGRAESRWYSEVRLLVDAWHASRICSTG
jgi:hypothetical protein